MERAEAIDRIRTLLDSGDLSTASTSMRMPKALRDAAALAVRELGAATSTTALTTSVLRSVLEGIVMEAALQEHFEHHPEARPDLGDLAVAEAELTGHPLAGAPECLRKAAREIVVTRPRASPEEVVLWAEAKGTSAA